MKRLCLLAMTGLAVSGCATMFGGSSTQPVAFNSAPEGAAIVINGVTQWTTPHVINIPRKEPPEEVTFRLAGYEPVTVRLANSKKIDPWFWANIFTYGIGFIVDWQTGAMWTHNLQNRVVVELEESQSVPNPAQREQ